MNTIYKKKEKEERKRKRKDKKNRVKEMRERRELKYIQLKVFIKTIRTLMGNLLLYIYLEEKHIISARKKYSNLAVICNKFSNDCTFELDTSNL